MNKIMRIVVVLTFLLVIIALGMQGTAWANNLGNSNPAQAANGFDQGFAARKRPGGTVTTGNPNVPLTVGQRVTVASCATVLLKNGSADLQYTASATNRNDFSKDYPGNLVSCVIMVRAVPANNKTTGGDLQVCFPIVPTQTGFAYYWDGTKWVKTILAVSNGHSCIDVPNTAPNPVFVAMFD